jgi:phosphoserine phosphatase
MNLVIQSPEPLAEAHRKPLVALSRGARATPIDA